MLVGNVGYERIHVDDVGAALRVRHARRFWGIDVNTPAVPAARDLLGGGRSLLSDSHGDVRSWVFHQAEEIEGSRTTFDGWIGHDSRDGELARPEQKAGTGIRWGIDPQGCVQQHPLCLALGNRATARNKRGQYDYERNQQSEHQHITPSDRRSRGSAVFQ